MEPNHYTIRQELCWKMMWAMRKHRQRVDAQLDSLGLGSGQVRVLMELDKNGHLTQRELAEKTHVTPATMSGTLKRMQAAGLVSRETDGGDARVSVVKLTQTGVTRNAQSKRVFESTDSEMLAGVSEEECAQMVRLLNIMLENMARVETCAEE